MVKRVLVGLLAALLVVTGCAIGAGAWWLWDTFGGPDGARRDLGSIPVPAGTTALVVDIDRISATVPDVSLKGDPALLIGDRTRPTSVYAASRTAVDDFLDGTPYAAAALAAGAWRVSNVPGTARLADPARTRWIASASGAPAALPIGALSPASLIIVPAPGATSVPIALSLRVPDVRTLAIASGAIAVLLVATGILLLWVAAFAIRPRGRHEHR